MSTPDFLDKIKTITITLLKEIPYQLGYEAN